MAVITISRQVGSMGDAIAGLLADELGYKLADKNAVRSMAEECDQHFASYCINFQEEIYEGFWEKYFYSQPQMLALFESLNLELAEQDNVILLGRGAQIVLSDFPGVLNVRVVAPTDVRVKRVMAEKDISEAHAAEYVEWFGKQRRNLIESVYQKDPHRWSLYDLVINTHHLNLRACVDLIRTASERKMAGLAPAAVKKMLNRAALAKRIETAILSSLRISPLAGLRIQVDEQGAVSLIGFLSDEASIERAGEIAKSFAGVKKVHNALGTTRFVV